MVFMLCGVVAVAALAVVTYQTSWKTGLAAYGVLIVVSVIAILVFNVSRDGVSDYVLGMVVGSPVLIGVLRKQDRKRARASAQTMAS